MNGESASLPFASQSRCIPVAQALMKDIESGRYGVGDLLPPELQPCTRFAVSRHTMREAIRRLQERGFITRHSANRFSYFTSLRQQPPTVPNP